MLNKSFRRFFRRIAPVFLVLFTLINFSTAGQSAPTTPAPFVHLFEWKWQDIAQECETFLAPHGYGAVQISPPNEHAVIAEAGYPWWQRYQPVSYKLKSRSGDRAQFTDMVARCHAVGVKIYADAVINHMAAVGSGVGSAGTPFTRYHYTDYEPRDFHTCRHGINDYGDRDQVTHCELVGLPDLDTSSPRVRQKIANYLIDLMQLGVDGFRIDAAKHMPREDIAAILKLTHRANLPQPFIYQEVIDPGTEAIRKSEYYENGQVLEFEYGKMVGEAFLGINDQHLSQLRDLASSPRLMPNDKAVVFIDNHDKQRGHGGGGDYLTYQYGKLYELANIFMLAYPYGVPQVMSSYDFTHSDQGPPANEQGVTQDVYADGKAQCFAAWVCEHRQGAIARMVGFYNQVKDTSLTNWWSNGKDQIAFGRGDQGFVVINRELQPLTQTFQTDLPSGFYCNVMQADMQEQGCGDAAAEIKVNWRGEMTVTVGGMDAIAIHRGVRISGR